MAVESTSLKFNSNNKLRRKFVNIVILLLKMIKTILVYSTYTVSGILTIPIFYLNINMLQMYIILHILQTIFSSII